MGFRHEKKKITKLTRWKVLSQLLLLLLFSKFISSTYIKKKYYQFGFQN